MATFLIKSITSAGLKSLAYLYLANTAVGDAGLKELAGFQSLQFLYLLDTEVTDAGIAKLKESLPSVTVVK